MPRMSLTIEGRPKGEGKRVGVVCARFNEMIVRELLHGCESELVRHGVTADAITVVWVPGAFEIPTAAERLAKARSIDAIVCLGAVIRGSTPHFDYVAGEAARGIGAVARESG